MAKSQKEIIATTIANLEAKTGKTLAQWLQIARESGLDKHGQLVNHLKSEHGLTHGYANMVAHQAREQEPSEQADPITTQYSGPKEALRPIYDAVIAAIKELGSDVEISPKKTYVSLRRNKQFALVQPSTRTRVDLGINLKGLEAEGRLEASGSFNAMVSHRVRLTSIDQVDAEVAGWLKAAYDKA